MMAPDYARLPLAEIWPAIGQMVAAAIPEEWVSALVSVEIESDDCGMVYGRYIPAAAVAERPFDPPVELFLAFEELRRRFHRPGCAAWRTARFTLQRRGRFAVDFTYPDAPGE